METLDGTDWDVTIIGTGLLPSILALSLSRSGKRILHLDSNDYYGGDEVALSLSEAEAWAARFAEDDGHSTFSCASVTRPGGEDAGDKQKLSPSRAYSLALAPHLIYARSHLLDVLVSSKANDQLEFQAVGSWFIVDSSASSAKLTRVPSGREDVFEDTSLSLKAKRSLMKFLRFVGTYEEQGDVWQDSKDQPFPAFLKLKFALPQASHGPILALTLSPEAPEKTTTENALPRIARYLRSIGVLGPGFGAVLPKWGGLAEIAQVACRACAVGGGVYVLNKSIRKVEGQNSDGAILLKLDQGEKISTRWICGSKPDLQVSPTITNTSNSSTTLQSRNISVISSPLAALFPSTSEGGVTPAGAVVVVPSIANDSPPVHLLIHTSDAGECPMSQCVVYASIAAPQESGYPRLEQAVSKLLESIEARPEPKVLWTLRYQQRSPSSTKDYSAPNGGIVMLPQLSADVAFDDAVLREVRKAWQSITGEVEDAFLRFEARKGMDDEDSF